jgi:uncharacterized repeat protein (TIGR03847 family)
MTVDLGTALGVDAQSYGQPGQRTFQIRIVGESETTASIWLEKQQLQALSLAISQVLAQTGGEDAPALDLPSFPDAPDTEIHAGRIAVGYDPRDRALLIQAHDLTTDEDADPDLLVRITNADCSQLNSRLKQIIAGGRPLCPLCAAPMDAGGHVCIRTNGHTKQPLPDRMEDEDEEE